MMTPRERERKAEGISLCLSFACKIMQAWQVMTWLFGDGSSEAEALSERVSWICFSHIHSSVKLFCGAFSRKGGGPSSELVTDSCIAWPKHLPPLVLKSGLRM